MKRIISLILALASVLSLGMLLVSCDMGAGNEGSKYGIVTDGAKTYFVADGGAVVIEGGKASAATAPAGTPESKKLTAPDTADEWFTYEEVSGKINITGLTDAGKAAAAVIIPKTIGGKQIASVSSLSGAKNVIIADLGYSFNLNNGALAGVTNVFLVSVADNVLVAKNLLDGTTGVKLYVSADEISNYKSHYNWSNFADKLNKF
jgi:hypothetical protein